MKCLVLISTLLISAHALVAQVDTAAVFDTIDSTYNYQYETEDENYVEHTMVDPSEVVKTTDYKNEKINVRKFDKDEWKHVVGSTNFQEEKEKPEPEKESSNDNFSMSIPWGSPVLKVIGYALIIGIVLTILYFVTKSIKFETKVDKNVMTSDHSIEHVENIEDLDINQLLQKSLNEGNYRATVRLYFLRLLKGLHEGGIIEWKKDKTNRDYLTEIFSKNYYYTEVQQLTLAYEEVWYGEHIISQDSYKELFSEFESVHQKLNTSKVS